MKSTQSMQSTQSIKSPDKINLGKSGRSPKNSRVRTLSRPRLRTILGLVNLIVLLMPLGALSGLRIYETELIRRTEAEVISQTALIKASFEQLLDEELGQPAQGMEVDSAGDPVEARWPVNIEERFKPVPVTIDLRRDEIVAYPGPPEPQAGPVHPAALRAGARLEPALVEAQKMTMSGMRVADLGGNVLASSQEDERGHAVGHHVDVQRALGGEFVKILRQRKPFSTSSRLKGLSRNTRMQVVVSIPVVHQGRVVGAVSAWRTPVDLPKALYENRSVLLILLGIFVVGVLGISLLTSFYIGRPIRRLMAQTREVAASHGGADLTEPIKKPGTREVQKLSESVAQMAETLQNRAEYIRTFARHVSHEFKTPLTTIRATVELLEDHLDEMSVEKRQQFLASLDADAERLQYLVTRLMDLARADMIAPDDAQSDVRAVVDEAVELGSTLGIDVLVDIDQTRITAPDGTHTVPGTEFEAAIGSDALMSVLSNLMNNAAQHGAHELRVTIAPAAGHITLLVADDGPGISTANAQRVFDEFFTTRRDAGGSGLGLAIARTMLRRHGAEIELISPDEGGATFAIRLARSHQSEPT